MSDWYEKIHAHADGELDQAERPEVERLLAEDRRAAAEHQWAVFLKETLRTKHVRPDSREAWNAAKARLDAIDALQGDNKVERFVGRFSWGFVGALFAVILFAGLLGRESGEISDRQLAGLFNTSTVDRQVDGAADADTIVRTEVGVALPDIKPLVQVTQVDKGEVDGQNFLRVHLLDNSGEFLLFIFPGESRVESLESIPGRAEFSGGTVNGQSCVAWAETGATFVLVADRSIDEVVSIADDMIR